MIFWRVKYKALSNENVWIFGTSGKKCLPLDPHAHLQDYGLVRHMPNTICGRSAGAGAKQYTALDSPDFITCTARPFRHGWHLRYQPTGCLLRLLVLCIARK